MVTGLNKFSEFFSGYEDSYVLIGGAASNLIEEENLLVPRATKDLDIILVVEALTAGFVKRFWQFVRAAGYQHKQRGTDKSEFYRFYKPLDTSFPVQIELLSRKPDLITLPKDIVIGPIPTGEELSSLSAIMLNDSYYHYTIENSFMVQGVHIAKSNALICLKAKAYINMQESKHRNDIIRLGLSLPADAHFVLPEELKEDMRTFFLLVKDDLPNDDFIKRAGAGNLTVDDVMNRIKFAMGLI